MPKKLVAEIYPHGRECECDCAAFVRADIRRFDSPFEHEFDVVVNNHMFDVRMEHDSINGIDALFVRKVASYERDAKPEEWEAVLRGIRNMYRKPVYRER